MACGRAINPKWWSMWFSWPAILVTVALNSSLVLSTPSLGRCSWCEETQTCFDFSSHICKMTNWDSPILNRNLFFYYSLVVYQFGMCGEWVDVEPKSHIGEWISRVVRHCEVTLGAIPNLSRNGEITIIRQRQSQRHAKESRVVPAVWLIWDVVGATTLHR